MQIAKIGSLYTYKYNSPNRVVKNNTQNPVETGVNPEVNDLNYYQNYNQIVFGQAKTRFKDCVTKSVMRNQGRYKKMSGKYLNVLDGIALKLKDYGVTFDRKYNEMNPVKSPEAYTSKIIRNKTFAVPDAIRATLYVENPYEMTTLFEKILPELEHDGYIVADTDVSLEHIVKRGYQPTLDEAKDLTQEVSVPDLDVRLRRSDLNPRMAKHKKYGFVFGKPQKSGYEDIQLRLIRKASKAKNPTRHELLVLFGPNYAEAKGIESKHVYDYLREFGELQMDLSNKTPGSNEQKVNRCIDMLQTMFQTEVSGKLFMNAKNKDFYKMSNSVPIAFTPELIKSFEECIAELKSSMKSYYKQKKAGYKKNAVQLKQCEKSMKADKETVTKIEDGLRETIRYFNEEYNKTNV